MQSEDHKSMSGVDMTDIDIQHVLDGGAQPCRVALGDGWYTTRSDRGGELRVCLSIVERGATRNMSKGPSVMTIGLTSRRRVRRGGSQDSRYPTLNHMPSH